MELYYDLIVIGSGPGGYVAAIKAAKLGMRTAIIEGREIGGTCLNRGCIPTKTLMHSSHLYYEAQSMKELGISFTDLSLDYQKIINRKDEVVSTIRQGITNLLEANGVTIYYGFATIGNSDEKDCHRVSLKSDGEEQLLQTGKTLIATGSKPSIPRVEGADLEHVVTSDELLTKIEKPYQRLLIIGAGVIGIEFATMYRELGCEVEIIEAMDRILPVMEKEIAQSISMNLKKKGVTIHTKATVVKITKAEEGGLVCEYEEKGGIKTATADGILFSVGRKANTEGLFETGIHPEMEGSTIKVNDEFETSIPGIYAIGDVIKGRQLAHAASAHGIVAVERMCGMSPSIDLKVVPSCIYTNPEVAVVGLSQEEAEQSGYTIKVGKYPMLGNSKTLLSKGERGFIKVICDANTDQILGAELLCDRATDLVSELAVAITAKLTSKELSSVIRPHPTYSEAITEALEDLDGMAIHLMPKRI